MQSLRDTLDIVEIIMGFVSSGKYDPNMKLRNFVSKFLKMEKRFASKKASCEYNYGYPTLLVVVLFIVSLRMCVIIVIM